VLERKAAEDTFYVKVVSGRRRTVSKSLIPPRPQREAVPKNTEASVPDPPSRKEFLSAVAETSGGIVLRDAAELLDKPAARKLPKSRVWAGAVGRVTVCVVQKEHSREFAPPSISARPFETAEGITTCVAAYLATMNSAAAAATSAVRTRPAGQVPQIGHVDHRAFIAVVAIDRYDVALNLGVCSVEQRQRLPRRPPHYLEPLVSINDSV